MTKFLELLHLVRYAKKNNVKNYSYLFESELRNDADDFFSEDFKFRFIHDSAIDDAIELELELSPEMIGTADSIFLSKLLKIDVEMIKTLQKSELFEIIGQLVISFGTLPKFQAKIPQKDYSKYLGCEEKYNTFGDWYVFRSKETKEG